MIDASKVIRSVLLNYTGVAVVTLSGFLLTPILIHHLGRASFGSWVVIASVLGYSSLLDLGVGLTVMRMVAERAHHESRTEVNEIATNGLLLYGSVGILMVILGVVAAPFIGHAFHLAGPQLAEFRSAFRLAVIAVGVTFPSGLYTGINQGFQNYRAQNIIVGGQALSIAIVSLAVVEVGGGIVALAAANAICWIGSFTAKAVYAAHTYSILPRPHQISTPTIRLVLNVSAWVFVLNLADKVILETDTIVVGSILGTLAVSAYAVALGPATAVRKLTDQFNSVTLSTASSLNAQQQMARLRRLLSEATRMVLVATLPFLVVFALWGRQLLRLWVGPSFAASYSTLWVLTLGIIATSVASSSTQLIFALDRQRLIAYMAAAEACCNLGLSVFLAYHIGIVGVAVGTTIPTCCTAAFYIPFAARLLNMRAWQVFRRLFLPIGVCGGVFALIRVLLPHLVFHSIPPLGLASGLIIGTCISLSILLDGQERGTYLVVYRRWRRRPATRGLMTDTCRSQASKINHPFAPARLPGAPPPLRRFVRKDCACPLPLV